MLINFKDIVKKYGKPRGIVHIGAHMMEEKKDYLSQGINKIIWIEANPKIFNEIKIDSETEKFFNYVISNVDDVKYNFNITNNGQSSSILKLKKHRLHHPNIFVCEIIEMMSKRMDTLFIENNLNIDNYNFINIDIQGAELLAIKSFGNLLDKVNFIYTEVNTDYLYENCSLINEIDEYLNSYGFKRVETFITEYEWGDALYIK